jgi:xylulose-5-phosphate/fructose-6-phosphate phosphoketolase
LHVHGYKEEGTTTTPFDMCVLINSTGSAWWTTSSTACRSWGQRAAYAQQAIREKVLDHKSYIARYGDDMPEVRDWQWGAVRAAKGGKADTAADNV